jgi:glycosyltransferase involved in cell wall biosynthesis
VDVAVKRLLYVAPDARFFVTHRLPLAMAARRAGFDVHVATPDGAAIPTITDAGLVWHRVRFGPLRKRPWSDLLTLIDLITLDRQIRPSLVHHVTFKAVLYGTIAARLNRVPVVVNAMTGLGDVFAANGIADQIWRTITIVLFRVFVRHRRMRIILQNEDDVETLIAAGVATRAQAILIRGSGVDPSHFVPAPRHAEAIPMVVCASRIVETKGIAEFIAAARALRKEGVLARFVLAGDRDTDSGKSISDALFDEWLHDGAVEYAGMQDDIRELYAAAQIVCLPSRGGEGVPKALIEAASCALPIVTTDVPGCRDIVRDGVNGFLVPARSVEPLAAALRTLIEDPALRDRMGRRGREIVIAEFSLQHVIDATLAVYTDLERQLA